MTLIVHIPAKKGSVMASDGQATVGGQMKMSMRKIHQLNDCCIWGAAGDIVLIERVEERIATFSEKEKPLQDICLGLSKIIPECIDELSAGLQPSSPYDADFAFIEYRDYPRILSIYADGTARWLANLPFAIGSGDTFALSLLRKYQSLGMLDMQLATVLAYKIVAETIEVVEGVGLPIDVWQLPPAKNLTKEELTGLEETYLGLRKAEIDMFLAGSKSAPSENPSGI